MGGPEFESEIVEESREKAATRVNKCPWWERYKENEIKPEFTVCSAVDQVMVDEGLKAINPKLTHKLTKAMPEGDPTAKEFSSSRKNKQLVFMFFSSSF